MAKEAVRNPRVHITEEEMLACLPMVEYEASRFKTLEAQDAKQEAALRMVEAALVFDPNQGAAFKTFAQRCIHRRLLMLAGKTQRQRNNRHFFLAGAETEPLAARSESEIEREYKRLDAAMAQLMPDVRQALEMRFGDVEATYPEIAAALGVCRTTVFALLAAGLARLKTLMEEK